MHTAGTHCLVQEPLRRGSSRAFVNCLEVQQARRLMFRRAWCSGPLAPAAALSMRIAARKRHCVSQCQDRAPQERQFEGRILQGNELK